MLIFFVINSHYGCVAGLECDIKRDSYVQLCLCEINTCTKWISVVGRKNSVQQVPFGDLNLDPLKPDQLRMIDVIRGKRRILLREATNKNRKNIDHIFGSSEHLVFCQAFLNFISDHFTITVRIALTATLFCDDNRLLRYECHSRKEPESARRKKSQIKEGQAVKRQKSGDIVW